MDKTNNLKEFLIDLYNAIARKKPDASRNPQDFSAEIESIQAGSNPVLTTATFTANDTYYAINYDADGFSSVTVKVPEVPEWDGSHTITKGGN